jgi:hypothetical protein
VTVAKDAWGYGGTWWGDWIYLDGLRRVAASGGTLEELALPEEWKGRYLMWPQVLPGGEEILVTVLGPSGDFKDSRVAIQRLDGADRWVVAEGVAFGRYLPTGHVLLVQSPGTVVVVPYDIRRHEVMGGASAVLSDVRLNSWGGGAQLAVSPGGTLAHVTGGRMGGRRLVRVDRSGKTLHPIGEPAAYEWTPFLSPNGEQLTITIRGPNDDVWVFDLPSGRQARVSFHPAEDETSVWSPDGSRVAYSGDRDRRAILVRRVDGSGEEQVIHESDHHIHLCDWTPDGGTILFSEEEDIWALPLAGGPPEVKVRGAGCGVVSPDGRWIAYTSEESGAWEIYVRGFASRGGPWQISTGGGWAPRWSRDGRELFFIGQLGKSLMTVALQPGPTLRWEAPRRLFTREDIMLFDVGPEAETFVLHEPNPEAKVGQIHVIVNWAEAFGLRPGGGS